MCNRRQPRVEFLFFPSVLSAPSRRSTQQECAGENRELRRSRSGQFLQVSRRNYEVAIICDTIFTRVPSEGTVFIGFLFPVDEVHFNTRNDMANLRKLQGEIDKVLKKVQEGLGIFDDIWDQVRMSQAVGTCPPSECIISSNWSKAFYIQH